MSDGNKKEEHSIAWLASDGISSFRSFARLFTQFLFI